MMKKITALLLIVLTLASFAACSNKPSANYDHEGYKTLLDEAIKLYPVFSEEQFAKVCHPNDIAYNVENYKKSNKDYIEAVRTVLDGLNEKYTALYGEDWKISYTIREAVEKDEKGIEKYKKYDSHYFKQYNIDTDKFQAVTFAKITVHIEGSKGSYDKDRTIQCFCIDGVWYSLYAYRIGFALAPSEGN
jgi:uncharacterized lipoprotein YehR (DUF1307 family)